MRLLSMRIPLKSIPLVDPRSLMKYVPLRRMTAACLRETLPSLMGRSDDFEPRPMMNWSLSIGYFWLSNTRYSVEAAPTSAGGAGGATAAAAVGRPIPLDGPGGTRGGGGSGIPSGERPA